MEFLNYTGLDDQKLAVDHLWLDYGNRQTTQFFLMDSPWGLTAILSSILLTIKLLAPKIGQLKFDPKPFMLVFNGFMFGTLSIGIPITLYLINFGRDCFDCNGFDPNSTDLKATMLHRLGYTLMLFKILDFGVPFFQAVRGKPVDNPHLLHVTSTLILTFLGLSFYPGGIIMLYPLLDIIHHAVYYAYLTMASAGYKNRPHAGWKTGVAWLRFATLVLVAFHGLTFLFAPNCGPQSLRTIYTIYPAFSALVYARQLMQKTQ